MQRERDIHTSLSMCICIYIYIYIYTYNISVLYFLTKSSWVLAACLVDYTHRWKRSSRPQPQTFSKLVSLIYFSWILHCSKLVIWGSSWGQGVRFHWLYTAQTNGRRVYHTKVSQYWLCVLWCTMLRLCVACHLRCTRGSFLIRRQRGHPGVVIPFVISDLANQKECN